MKRRKAATTQQDSERSSKIHQDISGQYETYMSQHATFSYIFRFESMLWKTFHAQSHHADISALSFISQLSFPRIFLWPSEARCQAMPWLRANSYRNWHETFSSWKQLTMARFTGILHLVGLKHSKSALLHITFVGDVIPLSWTAAYVNDTEVIHLTLVWQKHPEIIGPEVGDNQPPETYWFGYSLYCKDQQNNKTQCKKIRGNNFFSIASVTYSICIKKHS